jgi:hypothetical protein
MALAVWIETILSAGIAIFEEAAADNRRERFRHNGTVDPEDPEAAEGHRDRRPPTRRYCTEAPTGFDNLSNGYLDQGQDFETLNEDTVVPLRSFNDNRFLFEDPDENTWSGLDLSHGTNYDPIPDPEDDGVGIVAFADFMRSTKAPARGPITVDVRTVEALFRNVGSAICHVPTLVTTLPGTAANDGTFTVPEALGNKTIHLYSDFLLHDIGTGDGIPVLPTPEFAATAQQIRTASLCGLRARNRLMHDGLSFTKQEVIQRHSGQASAVTRRYNEPSPEELALVWAFLDSL